MSSLRDLIISIAFQADSSPLEDINKQVDEFSNNIGGASTDVDGLGNDISGLSGDVDNFGSSAVNSFDDASSSLNGLSNESEELEGKMGGLGQMLSDNWVGITAAAGGAGIALEAMARSGQELELQTGRIGRSMDMTNEEVKDLATSMSNATFDIADVTQLLEMGAQRGLDSAEALEKYGNTWDLIADGSGGNAVELAKQAVALEQIGIGAENSEEAIAAFGYITESTTQDVGDFLTVIDRVGEDMHAMGGDVNDVASILGILEGEMGKTGKIARQDLQSAIKEADGSFDELLSTLGISEDVFQSYSEAVEGSSDVLQTNAGDMYDLMTPLQHMQSYVADLTYEYGDFINLAAGMAPVLMAVGPAIKGVTMLTSLFNKTLLANPIVWVSALIIGLGVALYLAYNNIEWFRDMVDAAWLKIKEIFFVALTLIVDFVNEQLDKITAFWDENGTQIMEAVQNAMAFVGEIIQIGMAIIQGVFEIAWPIIQGIIEIAWGVIQNIIGTGVDVILGIIEFWSAVFTGDWQGAFDAVIQIAVDMWNGITGIFEGIDLLEIGKNIIQGLITGISSMAGAVWDSVKGIASGIGDTFKSALSIFSPSRLFEGFGIDTMLGYKIGFEDEAEDVNKTVNVVADDIGDTFSNNVIDFPADRISPIANFEPIVDNVINFPTQEERKPVHAPETSSTYNKSDETIVFKFESNIEVNGSELSEAEKEAIKAEMSEENKRQFDEMIEFYEKRKKAKAV